MEPRATCDLPVLPEVRERERFELRDMERVLASSTADMTEVGNAPNERPGPL